MSPRGLCGRHQSLGAGPTLLQDDLTLAHYFFKHPISESGHILRCDGHELWGGHYSVQCTPSVCPPGILKSLLMGPLTQLSGTQLPKASQSTVTALFRDPLLHPGGDYLGHQDSAPGPHLSLTDQGLPEQRTSDDGGLSHGEVSLPSGCLDNVTR